MLCKNMERFWNKSLLEISQAKQLRQILIMILLLLSFP